LRNDRHKDSEEMWGSLCTPQMSRALPWDRFRICGVKSRWQPASRFTSRPCPLTNGFTPLMCFDVLCLSTSSVKCGAAAQSRNCYNTGWKSRRGAQRLWAVLLEGHHEMATAETNRKRTKFRNLKLPTWKFVSFLNSVILYFHNYSDYLKKDINKNSSKIVHLRTGHEGVALLFLSPQR
jgi:hypothetical protein